MVIRLWNPIYGLADKNLNKSNIQKINHISDFYVFFLKIKTRKEINSLLVLDYRFCVVCYTTPCAIIASATFTKPPMFAPCK
jgi:hypothetical protein